MESLNILISNDDGIFADGIRSLAKTALQRGHKVTVVCPDQERSATGHGLTLQSPIRVERADELFEDGIQACFRSLFVDVSFRYFQTVPKRLLLIASSKSFV